MKTTQCLIRVLPCVIFVATLCNRATAAESAPQLRFEKIIGDMRGKGVNNLSVTVTMDGTVYLLMRSGRVAVFNCYGEYQKSLKVQLPWPVNSCYLSARGNQALLGDWKKDYPWIYSIRRKGTKPGTFNCPTMVAADKNGDIYVADTGNKRIQIFSQDNNLIPVTNLQLEFKPQRIAIQDGMLAVLGDDEKLRLYNQEVNDFHLVASARAGKGGVSVAFGRNACILVAFSKGLLKKYQFDPAKPNALKEAAIIAPSFMDKWPNFFYAGVPMTTGPDGQIWFGTDTHNKVLSLNPKSDKISERFRANRPLTIAFDRKGRVYVGGRKRHAGKGPILYVFSDISMQAKPKPFLQNDDGEIFQEDNVPIWGVLPCPDGGVYTRIVETGYRKGWPALAIKKLYPDGTKKDFLDFGNVYGLRRTFHPTSGICSLRFDSEGNIILASLQLVSVYKVKPDGVIIWEAGMKPSGGADKVEFVAPVDIAIDSKGNIWVIDGGKNKIFCLSPQGKLLYEYGTYADIDNTRGEGFNRPTGIAIAEVNGIEYLYVGDAGNYRIVKYRIELGTQY